MIMGRRMNLLKAVRHGREMAQIDLAKVTGINQYTLSLIETGRRLPTLEQAIAISHALGVEQELLFPSLREVADAY